MKRNYPFASMTTMFLTSFLFSSFASAGLYNGDDYNPSLNHLRNKLFGSYADGENNCAVWNNLDESQRAVFLTITHRLYISKTRDSKSMLHHIDKVYEILGGGDNGRHCGGLDNNRMFMSMDRYLWDELERTVSRGILSNMFWYIGQPSFIKDGGGRYWRESRDQILFWGGPHSPFDRSAETSSNNPRGQVQFYKHTTKAGAFTRSDGDDTRTFSLPKDQYMLEFDHDWTGHLSNPVCPGYDFDEIYENNFGDFDCGWVPYGCRPNGSGCYSGVK